MDEHNNISTNIKKFRTERGMTLEEVAKRCDTTKQTILRYEHGEINIPYDRIIKLSKCFGVNPGELMGFNESAKPKYDLSVDEVAIIEAYRKSDAAARLKAYALLLGAKL